MAQTSKQKGGVTLMQAFWFSVLAGFLLLITNSAIWVNRYIFDTGNFSNVVTTSLTSESSRRAIAQGVTDRVFADRPVLKNVVGDIPVNIVSGLLGTEQATKAIDVVATRLQTRVTSSEPTPIAVDLSGIKNVLTQLYNVSTNLGREPQINPENIPSEIVLVDEDDIPNLYRASVVFLWLAPLALIGAAVSLIYTYVKNKKEYKLILVIQGACIAGVGMLALLVGPLFRPPLLSKLGTESGRTVIGNLYDAFITTFNAQTGFFIGIGIVMMLSGGGLILYTKLKTRR